MLATRLLFALALLLALPARAAETPAAGKEFKDCAQCPTMVVVPAGRVLMGSPPREAGRDPDEGPAHEVAVGAFAIGKFEVTQGQWRAVMGRNPSYFTRCGADCPVENLTWEDAQRFLKRLSKKTGQTYRLPSEAEWEYACRAGGEHRYCGGDQLDALGWHGRISGGAPHPVGQKAANAFGLHDMSGNVLEWTADCWHPNFEGAPADGRAWTDSGDCSLRVLRNGGFDGIPDFQRAANRDYVGITLRVNSSGLRVARRAP